MRISTLLTILFLGGVAPLAAENTVGVDFVLDSRIVVYGGGYYSHRSQNPQDLQILYAEELATNVPKILYRGEGALSDIQASQEDDLVAVIERSWEENVSKERATYVDRRVNESGQVIEFYYAEGSTLVVLDLDGTIIGRIANVRRYAWNPRGGRIAYISGDYSEGGFGFRSTGTWVYDISTRQAEQIHSAGWDVHWASVDGDVYIYDPFDEAFPDTHVLRFDPGTNQLLATPHEGIYLSPNGSYYYVQGREGTPLKVFQTETDSEVPVDLSIESSERARLADYARGWFDEQTLIVASPVPNDDQDYLCDVSTGTIRRASGPVIPIRGYDDQVLVLEGTSVVEQRVSDLDVVRY
jgi:hypothetical protein